MCISGKMNSRRWLFSFSFVLLKNFPLCGLCGTGRKAGSFYGININFQVFLFFRPFAASPSWRGEAIPDAPASMFLSGLPA
ncbi:MAG: hypothetical protein ACI4O4_05980 [Candidatus Ventricola sp.]